MIALGDIGTAIVAVTTTQAKTTRRLSKSLVHSQSERSRLSYDLTKMLQASRAHHWPQTADGDRDDAAVLREAPKV